MQRFYGHCKFLLRLDLISLFAFFQEGRIEGE